MDDINTNRPQRRPGEGWAGVTVALVKVGARALIGPRRLMRRYVQVLAGLRAFDDHTVFTLAWVPSLRVSVTKLVARNFRLVLEQSAILQGSDYLQEAERRGLEIARGDDLAMRDAWALVVASRDPNILHQAVQGVTYDTLHTMTRMMIEECRVLGSLANRSFEEAVAVATD